MKLYGEDIWTNYRDLISDISAGLQLLTRGSETDPLFRTAIFQTSYPPFFDSWTGQCNSARFIPGLGARLTNALRDQLNILGQELNAALAFWIDDENGAFGAIRPSTGIDTLRFANQDEMYSQHRFCRDDVQEPDRNNPNTWFFNLFSNRDTSAGVSSNGEATVSSQDFASTFGVDASTCNPMAEEGGELGDTLPCLIAQAIADGNTDPGTVWPATRESIQKSFHPRIAGFDATSQFIQYRLLHTPGDSDFGNVNNLRIMAIGDGLTVGLNTGGQVNSYRQTLNTLLTTAGLNVEWVGNQVCSASRAVMGIDC